jgi:nicotinamidase-related amidase
MTDLDNTALLVIDVQRAFDDTEYWGERNNPDCEANVAALIDAWREARRPLVYVRHDSEEPGSPLAPGEPGNAFKDVVSGEPDLLVWLRRRGIGSIAVCGITTNHCVETTARMGANLGYDVLFALDATHTFDRTGPDGERLRADELARATATSLHGEFASVVRTEEIVCGLLALASSRERLR